MESLGKNSFFINAINDFSNEKDFMKATISLTNKLCQEYRFNKVTLAFNDLRENKFISIYNCISNASKTNYTDIYNNVNNLNFKDYAFWNLKSDTKRDHAIGNLFVKNNVIFTDDFKLIYKELEILEFDCIPEQITELLLYSIIDNGEVLGYFAFERHDEDCTSETDYKKLIIALDVVRLKMQDVEIDKDVQEKPKVNKNFLDTDEIDTSLMIIDKSTFHILYHNNCLGELNRCDVLNKKCYEVIYNRDVFCENCPLVYNELDKSVYTVKDVNSFCEYDEYIIRVSEITWKFKNDAYILSIINASEFVKEKLNIDVLTGSLTWHGLKEKIQNEHNNSSNKYAYISIDVDGIRYINDSYARVVGNEILKQISIFTRRFINSDEYFCRVAADTFGVIIKYVDNENLSRRINQLEIKFAKMFKMIFSEISIVLTGGIYIIEENLLKNLDLAFENTKIARNTVRGHYKNSFALYEDIMRDNINKRKNIENKVELAIENDEFIVYLQPKFNLITSEIIGAEALVRWNSSDEIIFPSKFIPVFEKNGFVVDLDFIVYEKVFKFIRECLDENLQLTPISINASRKHLTAENFINKLLYLFETYNIPRNLIEIEITENNSLNDDEKLCEFVKHLKRENIAISMDDFGSSYSSLNILKTLHVDTLKLDREFIHRTDSDSHDDYVKRDKIIIRNIVNMAKELDFNIICEGIENEEQLEFLKNIGCDYGQGYIFSKPLPLEKFKSKFLHSKSTLK